MRVNKKKILNYISTILIIYLLIVIPILFLFNNYSFNTLLIEKDVYIQTWKFHGFLTNEITFLNETELSHMFDVRNLFLINYILIILSLIILIIQKIKINKPKFRDYYVASSVIFYFNLILSLWALIDFNSLFYYFHLLFFENNFTFNIFSNIKLAYPNSYFISYFITYLILISINQLLLYIIKIKNSYKSIPAK